MPRNGTTGVATQPINTRAVDGETIMADKWNSVTDDIYSIVSAPTPVTQGGTGATTAAGALSNLGAEVASSYMSKSANYTALTTDNNATILFSAAATLSLPAIAGISSGWHITVFADGYEVTIDPNGTETIDGATIAIVPINETVQIVFDGSEFKMLDKTPDEIIASKSGNYTALHTDHRTTLRFTASATLTLTAAATLGANWYCEVWATSGAVTIDPYGTETINAATTLVVRTGQRAKVFCTGTAFFAFVTSDAYSGPHLQGYLYGLALTKNSSDASNDVDFAAGACASDTSPFYLMELSALTKRLDATWSVGNNKGMLDSGSVTDTTYYLYAIQRSDTLVTDFLASTSASAPTMPTNYDRKRLIGSLVRSGDVNGVPVLANASIPEVWSTSGQYALVAGGEAVFTHGLGVVPGTFEALYVCIAANNGYSVGDIVGPVNLTQYAGAYFGCQVTADATYVRARFAYQYPGALILNKSDGYLVSSGAPAASWRLVLRAKK